jgi:hypothetical protein
MVWSLVQTFLTILCALSFACTAVADPITYLLYTPTLEEMVSESSLIVVCRAGDPRQEIEKANPQTPCEDMIWTAWDLDVEEILFREPAIAKDVTPIVYASVLSGDKGLITGQRILAFIAALSTPESCRSNQRSVRNEVRGLGSAVDKEDVVRGGVLDSCTLDEARKRIARVAHKLSPREMSKAADGVVIGEVRETRIAAGAGDTSLTQVLIERWAKGSGATQITIRQATSLAAPGVPWLGKATLSHGMRGLLFLERHGDDWRIMCGLAGVRGYDEKGNAYAPLSNHLRRYIGISERDLLRQVASGS